MHTQIIYTQIIYTQIMYTQIIYTQITYLPAIGLIVGLLDLLLYTRVHNVLTSCTSVSVFTIPLHTLSVFTLTHCRHDLADVVCAHDLLTSSRTFLTCSPPDMYMINIAIVVGNTTINKNYYSFSLSFLHDLQK